MSELLERFRAAAAALNALPHGLCGRSYQLGVGDDAMAALASLPDANTGTTLFRDDHGEYAIDFANVVIDGVTFSAQSSARPLTSAEKQRLELDGREHARLVTA